LQAQLDGDNNGSGPDISKDKLN